MNLLPRAYNYLHLKNACPTDGRRVAQSFRAASIGTAKAVHYRFNKDVLHDKNENYFMPPVLSNPKNPINTINTTKGYTLIELAVVVVLIGLMLAISIPRFQYAILTDGLKTTTRRIVGLVKGLRNEAIREQKVYLLHFDIGSNRIWSESDALTEEERELARERYFQIPPDVHILDVWCSGKGKKVDGEVDIRFSKKGYVEQTVIHLGAEDGREFTLELSPFLGVIKIYDKYVDIYK